MKNRIVLMVMLIFVSILITSIYVLIKEFIEHKEIKDLHNNLIEQVIKPNEDIKIDEPNETLKTINWERLKEINEDIIGWIEIENMNISYPILKDNGSLYYLKHTFDRKYNKYGSIFTMNDNPFEDNETVIYGHNMKNDMMFSKLNNYLDNESFLKNSIYIYTPNIDYKATVFCCYVMSENNEEKNIKSLNFNEKIQYYQNKKLISNNANEIKKILKLSTCSYANNLTVSTNQRLYIIANLEKITKTD